MPGRQGNGVAAASNPGPAWQTENLRLSVFLTEPSYPEQLELWTQVVGAEPATVNTQGVGDQRVIVQEGPFLGARMRAEVRADRIDWLLVPSPPDGTPGNKPTAGPYNAIIPLFRERCLDWLDRASVTVNRMAYGAQLSIEPADRTSTLATLAGLLPTVRVDAENTWDFDYSINRRQSSQSIENLMINRLSKWSLAREIVGQIKLSDTSGPQTITTKTLYFPQLVLDINTIPEHSGSLDHLGSILEELVTLGTEIATKGDV